MPPTNATNSTQQASASGAGGSNQEKQIHEARIAIKSDSLLMKKALVNKYFISKHSIPFVYQNGVQYSTSYIYA